MGMTVTVSANLLFRSLEITKAGLVLPVSLPTIGSRDTNQISPRDGNSAIAGYRQFFRVALDHSLSRILSSSLICWYPSISSLSNLCLFSLSSFSLNTWEIKRLLFETFFNSFPKSSGNVIFNRTILFTSVLNIHYYMRIVNNIIRPYYPALTYSSFFSNQPYKTGKTKRVISVDVARPPTTTIASGFCTSEPGPEANSIGTRPNTATDAVIRIGRNRCSHPLMMASLIGIPSFLN